MESWTMVLNLHEDSNALFNIVSSQNLDYMDSICDTCKKTNMNSKNNLQKLKVTKIYGFLMNIFVLYFQKKLFQFLWLN